MNISWRPYQIYCKKSIKENYDKGITKQLIVAATGTGKRLMSLNLVKHFSRTLFIAHREELIMQAFNEIEAFWPLQAGIIKGKKFEIDSKIVVASVQTLYNRLDKIPKDLFDLVIVDECHHYVSPSYLKSIRHFTPKLMTAWTATPRRLDGLSLTNIVQECVFEYHIEDGIKDGFLAGLEAYQIKTTVDISRVKRTAGDFNNKELSEKVDSKLRNNLIVKKYEQYAKNRQAIAFCVDINHCYNLKHHFIDAGFSCEAVTSDTDRCPNRAEIINKFQKGEIDVLTNVNILTEGYDYNDIGAILMARPTQSETLYVQAIGRGTRLKSDAFKEKFGTDKTIILDFVDNSGKLSVINAWTLEEGKSIEDRMFIPEKHREKLIEEREKRHRMIKQQQREKDQKINLFQLPEIRPWQSERMLEPATEKQLKWIKELGMYQENVEYTKLMASEVISNLKAEEWMIRYLAYHNYDVRGKVTRGQYQKVKNSIDQKNKYKFNKTSK